MSLISSRKSRWYQRCLLNLSNIKPLDVSEKYSYGRCFFFSIFDVWFVVSHCLSCLCTLFYAFFAECGRYVDGVCGPTYRTSPGILKTGTRGRKLMAHWRITSNPRKTLVKTASKPHPEHRDLFKFYAWDAHTVTSSTFNVENLWFTYEWNKQKRDASNRITEQRLVIGTCLLSAVMLISPVILENQDRDDGPWKRDRSEWNIRCWYICSKKKIEHINAQNMRTVFCWREFFFGRIKCR